jgi:uncharacterized protein
VKRCGRPISIYVALLLVGVLKCAPASKLIVIGAGISGLSAALAAANAGANVIVLDASSVGGGHAIVSNAAICLVNTPLQRSKGVADSASLAEHDFLKRGEDADRNWVRVYARDSKSEIFDWLTSLGVHFYDIGQPPGNSVPRLHFVEGKGWGLVEPILRECLRRTNIQFIWATKARRLLTRNGRVIGVQAENLRNSEKLTFFGSNVIVATGGFGNNLELIRDNWPPTLSRPERLLAGAGHQALGSGMELVQAAGGTVSRLDQQWNYVLGMPDPEDKTGKRGLAAFDFRSIWVNEQGGRFTPEFGDEKVNLKALLRQPGGDYWSILDADGRSSFSITLAGWENGSAVDRLVFGTGGTAISASTLEGLAQKISVNPKTLTETVRRYNHFVDQGEDQDFHAFDAKTNPKPHKIQKPPFYAVRFFPITRKTMGGIDVDLSCRALNRAGQPIPGLYAVGEATGFGGINGRAALEGTFLGPAILMGRIAARSAIDASKTSAQIRSLPVREPAARFDNRACTGCHNLLRDVAVQRSGYWHFEQSHRRVDERQYRCASCHQHMYPFVASHHKQDRISLFNACSTCHSVQPRA